MKVVIHENACQPFDRYSMRIAALPGDHPCDVYAANALDVTLVIVTHRFTTGKTV